MKRLKVVLIVPNFQWADDDMNALWHYIPYNLCLLAAMVEDVCDISILDVYKKDMTEEEFIRTIKEVNPDIVGITVLMDQYAPAGHKAAKLVKEINKDTPVVIGGVYATMNSYKAIKDPNIDFVVIGEGEYVFKELIGYFMKRNPIPLKGICYRSNGEVINKGHSDFIDDLDVLPLPAYRLIDFESYGNSAHRKSVDSPRKYPYGRIMTSRGCPFNCIFCQVASIMGKKFRPRNPQKVLDEIEFLKEKYGINSIIFDDDNLFTDKQRAKEIFQGMIDRNLTMPWYAISVAVFKLDEDLIKLMRVSGCEYINIAIESGSERVLKQVINKPVNFEHAKEMVRLSREQNIYVAANFIIGYPTESWDEIRQTVKFAEDINVDYVKIFTANPLPNTRLWELCEKENAFKKDINSTDKIWSTGQMIETDQFSANDVTILRAYEWDRINFADPQKRKRTASRMGVTEDEIYQIRRRTFNNAHKAIR